MAEFFQFLGLPEDADDDAATLSLTAMLTTAIRDDEPAISLSEIYHKVSTLGGSRYLDPLHALPLLADSPDPKSSDLVGIIGECCPAREVLIATQECLERLSNDLQRDREEDRAEEAGKKKAPIGTIVTIVDLYAAIIQRIKLRNRSALETIRLHLDELQEGICLAAHQVQADQVPQLLSSVSTLASRTNLWLGADPKTDAEAAKSLLSKLLSETLLSSSHALNSSIAQRTFEQLNPRFRRPGSSEGWRPVEESLQQIFAAYTSIGLTTQDLLQTPSPTSLIVLAHFPTTQAADLPPYLPLIIASIHSNALLDESLAVLLKYLYHPQNATVTDEVAGPVLSILPELASGHSDPQIRHVSFRLLAKLLSLTQPVLRMEILTELTSKSEFPQMRVAAVGLVKDAVLEALPSPTGNPFASPVFLRAFGPILFRLCPSDLLTSKSTTLDDLEDSQEAKRLLECLSLYYVLLERDSQNLTGIRDKDVAKSIDNTLISPLQSRITEWEVESDGSNDLHHMSSLLPLRIAIERVKSAKERLQL